MAELSPMMKQYFQIKKDYPNAILMFRLGDFYEMFFEDAKIASKELELVLTGRDCGQEERAPMCGVPFHSADSYIARLVSRGYKVAICEQTEDPAKAKGIVKRDVIRIVTPATAFDSSMLDEGKNNYLGSVYLGGKDIGVCFVDISTGAIHAAHLSGRSVGNIIVDELSGFMPKEMILNDEAAAVRQVKVFAQSRPECIVNVRGAEDYDTAAFRSKILAQFPDSASAQQLQDESVINAVGISLEYLEQTQKTNVCNIGQLDIYTESQFMKLDASTRRNLELCESMRSGEKRGSLLWVLDKTGTAMGKRMLRSWIEKPLVNAAQINKRANAVEELFKDVIKRSEIKENLSGILDLERIISRIAYKTANAKELRALSGALGQVPALRDLLKDSKCEFLKSCYTDMDPVEDIKNLIDSAIVEEPPFSVREGGMIRAGFNSSLDELNDIMKNASSYLEDIEKRERESTGIKKLRIGYNKVYGYYIEVTNSFKELVPETYIRKQTLTNCERYITDELKQLENKILSARERAVVLENEIFCAVRDKAAQEIARIQRTADSIARADAVYSLAQVAAANDFVRPDVDESDIIEIRDGRHPVVEQMAKDSPFVPNDALLDCSDNRVAIITGPNMAGKSTFMRQVAVITLMAQVGSFVPASKAHIGIVDSIFTRVGASDDLASGQSTFMVEMNEVANILKNATDKSLIIYDEIGRGTSTFDGMSIARAVLEYTADKKSIGAKTLFATHYHELTVLEQECRGVKNYNIAVKKRGNDITFLRRIVPGGTDDSYGIDVASLAGVPAPVIKRAKEVLGELESSSAPRVIIKAQEPEENEQMSFGSGLGEEIVNKLKLIDVNTLTPIEALSELYKLVSRAKEL